MKIGQTIILQYFQIQQEKLRTNRENRLFYNLQ